MKNAKKSENPGRKQTRSNSNNNQPAILHQTDHGGKAGHNKDGAESVDGHSKGGLNRLNHRVMGNITTASRHNSSRSNKNIQKFQTHFPSSFNSNVKGLQYQNENHGQSGMSIGASNGSNSALDKLERQTANFGQVRGDRSSRLRGSNTNQKPDHQYQGAQSNPKTNIKVKFANPATAGSNASSQLMSKFQSSHPQQPQNMKMRVKTENSNNKGAGLGGVLNQQRQQSTENLMK